MKTKPRDPRFKQLEQAKQELQEQQRKDPNDELTQHDGYWDEIEVLWYDLIDDYDTEDLKNWGVAPV
jgi:hypothetical protein